MLTAQEWEAQKLSQEAAESKKEADIAAKEAGTSTGLCECVCRGEGVCMFVWVCVNGCMYVCVCVCLTFISCIKSLAVLQLNLISLHVPSHYTPHHTAVATIPSSTHTSSNTLAETSSDGRTILTADSEDGGRKWDFLDFSIDWLAVRNIAMPLITKFTFRTNGTCLSPR